MLVEALALGAAIVYLKTVTPLYTATSRIYVQQGGPKIKSNCIDCHMPLEQTQAIVSQTGDKVIRTTMRTRWIRVYQDESIRRDSELIKHLD